MQTKRQFFVYLLRNALDGVVFYVGKGSCNRLCHHLGRANSGSHLPVHQKIREVLGLGGQVLYEKVFVTDEEFLAFDEERMLIAAFGRDNLTNLTDGGEGSTGAMHPQDSVMRRAEKLRGRKCPWNAERNKRISADPAVRRKISETLKRRYAAGEITKPNLGKTASSGIREKLSRSHLGIRLSPESIAMRTETRRQNGWNKRDRVEQYANN
jgi:hypothetical protein